MKKILHIVESFGAGVYNYLINLLNNTADDFEMVVFYAKREHTPENFKEEFDNKIRFIESKYMQRDVGINDLKAILEIKKLIKEEKPDVVHLHSSKAGLLGRIAINTKKTKTYYTPHGYSFLMQDDSNYKKKLYKFIEKSLTLTQAITIACSKGEYNETLKLTDRVLLVNNGVNLNHLISYIKRKK